ncbi:MAG: hypothetical protein HWE07_04015 [Cytophagia bacterium]|nr:hypothetical protein [Cytophagia bacterium]
MKKAEFEQFVGLTLDELWVYGEMYIGWKLPTGIEFEWMKLNSKRIKDRSKVIEEIVSSVYINEEKIYPCVDLSIKEILNESCVLVVGRIASYEPRPFQKGYTNRSGPFIYGVNHTLISPDIDTKSLDFKNLLRAKGLLRC